MISDLPRDVAEDVYSRIPLTSLRGFRSTCKDWNNLSKDRSFNRKRIDEAKAAVAREFMMVMVIDNRVYLMDLKFPNSSGHGPSINRRGKLVSLVDSDDVNIPVVYQCDGLLLCITTYFSSFVVWNPYTGHTRWFKPRLFRPVMSMYSYAIGYEKGNKSCRIHKIMRFAYCEKTNLCSYEIFEVQTNSWKTFDVTFDWKIMVYARGVSIKGNTYWFAHEKYPGTGDFLFCFDFTQEKFGPRLPLPFHSGEDEDTVTLSSLREEQLAVLFQRWETLFMEIWVTTTIEPDVVVWKKFLAVDMQPLTDFQFSYEQASFFIDEENKIVVVIAKDGKYLRPSRNVAYFIGEDGYFKEVDLGESTDPNSSPRGCSYVPSLVYIKQGGKRKGGETK